jgi:sugar O-acyltransferase (sialic acid O-acetyltransferase NeuD family)
MYLYGASGHSKVIIDILKSNNIEIDGLIDDNESINELLEFPVFHESSARYPIIISIGSNRIRKQISEKLGTIDFGKAFHSSAIVSEYANIGDGTVVMQNSVIQSCARIGNHCIINTSSIVEHDCIVEDFVHISPNVTLCGGVSIGEGSWIGAGSVVIQGIKIGKWSVIGAGSVVTRDIPDGVVAYGNNCKIIKKL